MTLPNLDKPKWLKEDLIGRKIILHEDIMSILYCELSKDIEELAELEDKPDSHEADIIIESRFTMTSGIMDYLYSCQCPFRLVPRTLKDGSD